MRILGLLLLAAGLCIGGCAGDGVERASKGASSGPAPSTPADAETGGAGSGPGAPKVLRGNVVRVIDGDTVKVESRGFETTVRLLGIDAPETRRPGSVVQCFGPAASDRAKRLLPEGQAVVLVTDPSQDLRDRFGRLLAYVYKPGASGPGGSVNFALVATGHAKVYVYRGRAFRHLTAFRAAEAAAKRRSLGLWGPPCRGDTTKGQPVARSPATIPSPLVGAIPRTGSSGGCDPRYRGACVPPYPPDVDCPDVAGPVTVVGSDPHRLDRDHDGIACE